MPLKEGNAAALAIPALPPSPPLTPSRPTSPLIPQVNGHGGSRRVSLSTSLARPLPKERFATFTLAEKHRGLPLTARLWLQSRVVRAPDTYRAKGRQRPQTFANYALAADLVRACLPRCAVIFAPEHRRMLPRLGVHLLWRVLEGVGPAAR